MTSTPQRLFQPVSLGLATTLTGLMGLAAVVAGFAAIASQFSRFGLGVGVMLIVYGAMMLAVTWAAYRRFAWAWGLLVATALLNAFTVGSFLETQDAAQRYGMAALLVVTVVAGVAAILPATRLAMDRGR
ncbi:hypothetical protein [Tessaracoccus oleiagri]|uniref:Uncharacterized protein n=1 Tax=Tessaracoccus oleiagri TaxID=686624 RepID=A0A1G9LYI8_9ACTN|nr:hypothetical protein [Tessaracoccus oleiagri]SDL67003.1 hypothetical protein SAMN04488242_2408 [Tessaracoccus oleiagri]